MRNVAEDHERQQSADEGCDGIIGACSRRAEASLCVDIEENAEPVCHKSHAEDGKNAPKVGYPLSENKTDYDRARTGAKSLDHHDLQGVFFREPSCAVVFNAPAEASQENKQRAEGEFQT